MGDIGKKVAVKPWYGVRWWKEAVGTEYDRRMVSGMYEPVRLLKSIVKTIGPFPGKQALEIAKRKSFSLSLSSVEARCSAKAFSSGG